MLGENKVDREKAHNIANAALEQERQKSLPLVQAGKRTRRFVDRLRIGFFNLAGAYFGWRIAHANPELGIPPLAAGFVLGLAVAVVFPVRKT
ncbi:MAG: hypothetical protein EOP50_15275 [Sphingobacteriales bacterium]|nr:MAG: hypothetical protein EOP50_15275 [Sphingobacteriales bacterium]